MSCIPIYGMKPLVCKKAIIISTFCQNYFHLLLHKYFLSVSVLQKLLLRHYSQGKTDLKVFFSYVNKLKNWIRKSFLVMQFCRKLLNFMQFVNQSGSKSVLFWCYKTSFEELLLLWELVKMIFPLCLSKCHEITFVSGSFLLRSLYQKPIRNDNYWDIPYWSY